MVPVLPGSRLFLPDLPSSHAPESAGKPDALQTLRAERTGFANREAYGVRGFTPAFRARLMGNDGRRFKDRRARPFHRPPP